MVVLTIFFRKVIAATILVYLWSQHEVSFQRAFAASGRIDVDPCCKWLIQAAIDASTRALTIEIADAAARGGPMALALAGHSKASAGENEAITPASARLDVLIASTISKSLMTEIEIDETMVSIIIQMIGARLLASDPAACYSVPCTGLCHSSF